MNAIERHIEFFRVLAKAAPDSLIACCRSIDKLPRVLITDAGTAATLIALSGRNLAKQFPHAHETAVPSLRSALVAIADALQMEQNARGEVPWHLRGER